MDKKTYLYTVTTLFFIITLLHILRVLSASEVTIGGVTIPMWCSWVAVLLAGYLVFQGYRLAKE